MLDLLAPRGLPLRLPVQEGSPYKKEADLKKEMGISLAVSYVLASLLSCL